MYVTIGGTLFPLTLQQAFHLRKENRNLGLLAARLTADIVFLQYLHPIRVTFSEARTTEPDAWSLLIGQTQAVEQLGLCPMSQMMAQYPSEGYRGGASTNLYYRWYLSDEVHRLHLLHNIQPPIGLNVTGWSQKLNAQVNLLTADQEAVAQSATLEFLDSVRMGTRVQMSQIEDLLLAIQRLN